MALNEQIGDAYLTADRVDVRGFPDWGLACAETGSPIIHATSDVFFKYLFGNVGSEPVLLSFINAVLGSGTDAPVQEVEIRDPFTVSQFAGDTWSVVDVRARDEKGRIFNIEMQSVPQREFVGRTLYYWASTYAGQLTNKREYELLRPVVCINVLDFMLRISRPGWTGWHECFTIKGEHDSGQLFAGLLSIHMLELPRLIAKNIATSQLERWLVFLRDEGRGRTGKMTDDLRAAVESDPAIELAHQKFLDFLADEDLRHLTCRRIMAHADKVSYMKYLREEGLEQGKQEGLQLGREEGLQIGRQEGRQIGLQEGRQEGRQETLRKIIVKLRDQGMQPEAIAALVECSTAEVQALLGSPSSDGA